MDCCTMEQCSSSRCICECVCASRSCKQWLSWGLLGERVVPMAKRGPPTPVDSLFFLERHSGSGHHGKDNYFVQLELQVAINLWSCIGSAVVSCTILNVCVLAVSGSSVCLAAVSVWCTQVAPLPASGSRYGRELMTAKACVCINSEA